MLVFNCAVTVTDLAYKFATVLEYSVIRILGQTASGLVAMNIGSNVHTLKLECSFEIYDKWSVQTSKQTNKYV